MVYLVSCCRIRVNLSSPVQEWLFVALCHIHSKNQHFRDARKSQQTRPNYEKIQARCGYQLGLDLFFLLNGFQIITQQTEAATTNTTTKAMTPPLADEPILHLSVKMDIDTKHTQGNTIPQIGYVLTTIILFSHTAIYMPYGFQ
jgi:hypothetical protein